MMSTEKKNKIKERDEWKCVLCNSREQLTIDHIKAVSEGGTDEESNLRTLCWPCNFKKANKPASWFVRLHNWIFSAKTWYEYKREINTVVCGVQSALTGLINQQSRKIDAQDKLIQELLAKIAQLSSQTNTNNTEIYSRISKLKDRLLGLQEFQGIEWVDEQTTIEPAHYQKIKKTKTLEEAARIFNSKHHSL